MRQRGFTLIELLVVMGIIGVLAAIMAPALGAARMQARRVACGEVLHGLAVGIKAYLSEFNDIYPAAAQMPSVNAGLPSMPVSLSAQVSGAAAWRCPADSIGYVRGDGVAFNSYFAGETLSFEYNMSLGGRRLEKDFLYPLVGAQGVFILSDFDAFHGVSGQANAKNLLFGDGHIGSIDDIVHGTTSPQGAGGGP